MHATLKTRICWTCTNYAAGGSQVNSTEDGGDGATAEAEAEATAEEAAAVDALTPLELLPVAGGDDDNNNAVTAGAEAQAAEAVAAAAVTALTPAQVAAALLQPPEDPGSDSEDGEGGNLQLEVDVEEALDVELARCREQVRRRCGQTRETNRSAQCTLCEFINY
jgi:hypothetical protein